MSEANVPSIHHLGIPCSDVARSVAFYERLLGGDAVAMAGHTLVVAGAVRVALVELRDDDPRGFARASHVALAWPAGAREALLGRLDELRAPREEVRGRIYTRDPDGFTVELLFE